MKKQMSYSGKITTSISEVRHKKVRFRVSLVPSQEALYLSCTSSRPGGLDKIKPSEAITEKDTWNDGEWVQVSCWFL